VVRAGEQRGSAGRTAGLGHECGGRGVLGQGLPGGPLMGDLVQPPAEPFGQAAGVGEDDRGAVRLDQIGDPLLHMRPDRGRALRLLGVRPAAAQLAEVLDRDDHRQVEPLLGGGLNDRHLALRAEEARYLVHRAHRRGQPDPARGRGQQLVQPLQRQRQVRAALGPGDGVDLVEDDRLHAAQGLPGGGGEQQEQRLGGGDQDVRRVGGEAPPLGGRGVARADAHLDPGLRQAQADGGLAQARERGAQIALDVHRQGLQR